MAGGSGEVGYREVSGLLPTDGQERTGLLIAETVLAGLSTLPGCSSDSVPGARVGSTATPGLGGPRLGVPVPEMGSTGVPGLDIFSISESGSLTVGVPGAEL